VCLGNARGRRTITSPWKRQNPIVQALFGEWETKILSAVACRKNIETVTVWDDAALSESIIHSGKRLSTESSETLSKSEPVRYVAAVARPIDGDPVVSSWSDCPAVDDAIRFTGDESRDRSCRWVCKGGFMVENMGVLLFELCHTRTSNNKNNVEI